MTKILVAEDNELNMKLFFDILKYQNYDVTCSFDGLEAYNKIKENKFDLIILDIQLPKLDGFSLIKKLQDEKYEMPPVIVVSACAMDEDKKKAKNYNIASYLTKPIDINIFLKTVKKYIA